MDVELIEIGTCPCCGTIITAKDLMYHVDRIMPCPNCNRDLYFKLDYYPTEEEWYRDVSSGVQLPQDTYNGDIDPTDTLPF